MGLFNFLRKKSNQSKPDDFEHENVIEECLRRAATEPAYRLEFYEKLLSAKLVVLTNESSLPNGGQILKKGTTVNIVKLPDGRIPIFTSNARIFDKGVIKHEVPVLTMKGGDLFNLATGATFILNPYSDYGKELLPNEIGNLLKGTILTDNHKQITIQQETKVQIGHPAIYPTNIVNSLNKLFRERPGVKAAYLGWIFNPSSGEPAHLIFAFDIEGDRQTVTAEAGFIAHQWSKPDEIIDFIQIDEHRGLSDYFTKQTKPFYVR